MALGVFMLILLLLMPLFMIVFGRVFMTNAPKDINTSFGYRTKRSMKNQDTWAFAHKKQVLAKPCSLSIILFSYCSQTKSNKLIKA